MASRNITHKNKYSWLTLVYTYVLDLAWENNAYVHTKFDTLFRLWIKHGFLMPGHIYKWPGSFMWICVVLLSYSDIMKNMMIFCLYSMSWSNIITWTNMVDHTGQPDSFDTVFWNQWIILEWSLCNQKMFGWWSMGWSWCITMYNQGYQ